jgi:KUP system potassium uptake protein
MAAAVYTLMSTWRRGRLVLGMRLRERVIQLELFLAELLSDPPHRVPGTAVFMSGNPIGTPPALRYNVLHNKILHETVVILNVETADVPHVPASERVTVEQVGEGFWRVTITYGFMDEPNVPRTLGQVKEPAVDIAGGNVSFFLGRETILPRKEQRGMALWREHLFTWMSRNSQTATHFFHLPPERVVEVGVQVEL